MKNKALIYLLLAGGAIFLLSMKKKPKGYSIMVPEPGPPISSQLVPVSLKNSFVSVEIKILPTIPKLGRLANVSELNLGVPF